MVLFVVFESLKAWFRAPFLVSAAPKDLTLFQSSKKFESVDRKISTVIAAVLLTETPGT